jgi:hypothetical protein
MPLWAYTFEEITEDHLRSLDASDVPESHRIDFKRDCYKQGDADTREFLKDISAFANLSGGHVVIGFDEKASPGSRLVGVQGDVDKEIARLENLARDGLEPRISGLRLKAVTLGAGKVALLARIPMSWNGPHRVVAGRSNRFYLRNSNGVHEMSLSELRAAFNLAGSVRDRMLAFRKERVEAVTSGNSSIPIQGPSRLAIHVMPLVAFTSGANIDMGVFDRGHSLFPPLGSGGSGFNARLNFDGYVSMTSANDAGEHWTYTQLYRDGIIEAVVGDLVHTLQDRTRYFPLPEVESYLLEAASYTRSLSKLGVGPPYGISVSAMGVKGSVFYPRGAMGRPRPPLDRDQLLFAPAILDNGIESSDWKTRLRPVADALWNSFGYTHSPSFATH